MNASTKTLVLGLAVVSAITLAGCASVPPTVDEGPVTTTLEGAGIVFERERLTPLGEPAPLPPGELSTAQAVAWTLDNHPQVRVVLAGLDAEAAGRWQAGLLPNPMLSVMGLRRDGGGWMIEYGLMQSLIAVLERPRRVAEADAALGQATAEAAVALLELARDVEAAHLLAVASAERVGILEQRLAVVDERLALLSREQASGRAGVLELIELEREATEARADLVRARVAVSERRAALALAMGLDRGSLLVLPRQLPRPPEGTVDASVMQDIARRQRPELGVVAAEGERAAAAVELGRFGRGVDVLDVGVRREPGALGPELRLSIPVFDASAPRVARARAGVDAAEARQVLLQRRVGVEVERAVLVLAGRQDANAEVERAAGQAAEGATLAGRLQAGGAGDLGQSLRAEDAALQAGLARVDARLALWEAWLELAAATASALAEPRDED